eukprot:596830-Amphidinium_carterae.1
MRPCSDANGEGHDCDKEHKRKPVSKVGDGKRLEGTIMKKTKTCGSQRLHRSEGKGVAPLRCMATTNMQEPIYTEDFKDSSALLSESTKRLNNDDCHDDLAVLANVMMDLGSNDVEAMNPHVLDVDVRLEKGDQ